MELLENLLVFVFFGDVVNVEFHLVVNLVGVERLARRVVAWFVLVNLAQDAEGGILARVYNNLVHHNIVGVESDGKFLITSVAYCSFVWQVTYVRNHQRVDMRASLNEKCAVNACDGADGCARNGHVHKRHWLVGVGINHRSSNARHLRRELHGAEQQKQ